MINSAILLENTSSSVLNSMAGQCASVSIPKVTVFQTALMLPAISQALTFQVISVPSTLRIAKNVRRIFRGARDNITSIRSTVIYMPLHKQIPSNNNFPVQSSDDNQIHHRLHPSSEHTNSTNVPILFTQSISGPTISRYHYITILINTNISLSNPQSTYPFTC